MERNNLTVSTESMTKIKIAIQDEIPLTVTTYTLPHRTEDYMNLILTTFLQELHQDRLVEYLKYCLSELLTNSKKANTKRIYFREKNLNIFDKNDYDEGMRTFKAETLDNINHYLELQRAAGLYVRLVMQVRRNMINIEVRNNAEMTFEEYKRVHDKLNRAQQYTSMEQALSTVVDATEGGGLGLVIMILMLRKVGLTEENFQILCERGETITRIILPLDVPINQEVAKLSKDFLQKVETLKLLPTRLKVLEELCDAPETEASDIASFIAQEPGMVEFMLREIDFALYEQPVIFRNLTQAINAFGFSGTKKLARALEAVHVLLPEVAKLRDDMQEHTHRVALYARLLAKQLYPAEPEVADDAYISGIMHDIGTFVFDAVHPDLLDNALDVSRARGFSVDVFERMTTGVTHCDLGAALAEKWDFPKVISAVIRYHHDPNLAPGYARKVTYLIHLANFIGRYEPGKVDFTMLDSETAENFGITSGEQLNELSLRFDETFNAVKKRSQLL